MIYYFICLLIIASLWTCVLVSNGQAIVSYSRPQAQIPDPLFVLNSSIINGLLSDFKPNSIKNIRIYKEASDAPPYLKNLGPASVIDISYHKHINSKSFAQIGRRLGLRGPLTFAVNGYAIAPAALTGLRVAPAAIAQIHITQPTPESPETRVDIWTVSEKPDDSKNQPGSIMIR